VSEREHLPWIPPNFLALPAESSGLDEARTVLIPVPYDSTTSLRGGARNGPAALIEASYGLEDYDHELDLDVSLVGIHTTQALEPHMGGPDQMVKRVRAAVASYTSPGRIVGVLGGEHSVCIGSAQANLEVYPDLSVLYIDAHADLRDEYMGTPFGHASGARRIHELCPLVLVGVRSLCQEERDYINANSVPTFYWPPSCCDQELIEDIVGKLGPTVYISLDLDALDPAVMSAVGTPEPGGLGWYQLVSLLRRVAETKRIVGFDITELSPAEGPAACSYTAAKLVYKLVAYATSFGR